MSHGPSTEGSVAEPNLTPLLDVVMQLLMFFMMCVNFVTEQVNEDIKLPVSEAARPMDKAETDVLFLNIKPFVSREFQDKLGPDAFARAQDKFRESDPVVLVVGKEPMKLLEAKYWLKQQFEDAQKNASDGKVKTAVIIRAHLNTDYAHVFQVLQWCKAQGYTKLKLRAKTKSGSGT